MTQTKFIVLDFPGCKIDYPESRLVEGRIDMKDVLQYCLELEISGDIIKFAEDFLTEKSYSMKEEKH